LIPRTLHQVWVGPDAPALFDEWSAAWRELHPTWDYVLWTSAPPEFLVAPLIADALAFVPERNVGQFTADLMRYELLYRFGGVYVDRDMEPRKPIDGLIAGIEWTFAAWEQQDVWVNNAVMGSVALSSFLGRVLDAIPASVEEHRGSRPNISTGPRLITKLFREDPTGLEVFDADTFYPYRFDSRSGPASPASEFTKSYAVHRWANKLGVVR
jgi:inositol phosphorylceramide mannosyltransferase catalytic subunit